MKKWSDYTKRQIGGWILVFSLFPLFMGCLFFFGMNNNKATREANRETRTVHYQMQKLGFDEEKASDIEKTFNRTGIYELDEIKKGAGQGIDKLQSYVATANDSYRIYFTFEYGRLYYIGYGSTALYEKNRVVNNFDDTAPNYEEQDKKVIYIAYCFFGITAVMLIVGVYKIITGREDVKRINLK